MIYYIKDNKNKINIFIFPKTFPKRAGKSPLKGDKNV